MNSNYQKSFDVIVAGGGAAGVMAATASARNGAKVLLIEGQNCLGGSRTATGVDTFYGFYTPGENPQKVVGGISDDLLNSLKRENAIFERPNTYGAGTGLTYDVEVLKVVYEDLVQNSGADLLYHSLVCSVKSTDGIIESVLVANKNGLTEFKGKYFIDTTGDADLVASTGVGYHTVEPEEQLQSLTTIFFLGNVNIEQALQEKHSKLVELMKEANDCGKFNLPRVDGSFHRTPNHGVIQANMVRVTDIDPTDPFQLTKAEIQGRKQVKEYVRFLKEKVKGFENSFLINTSQSIGIRETRKINGYHVLTEDDVVSGRKFYDSIACCGAPIEEHHSGQGTRWAYIQGDGIYNIPYRCLVPVNLKNVIVAGRCLSATHGAQASARNSAQVMAMGQAAGTAAALCLKNNNNFRDLDVTELQRSLLAQGAIL